MNKIITVFIILFPISIFAKRLPPPDVPPIISNGIKYSANQCGMGCVNSIELKTNKELWKDTLYKVVYSPNIERDIQDIFIKKMWLCGHFLYIKNEKGIQYQVRIKDGHFQQYDFDEALETYGCDDTVKPTENEMIIRAAFFYENKKYAWAQACYQRVLKINSNSALAHFGLAKIANVNKDTSAYRKELTTAYNLNPNDSLIKNEFKKIQSK
jgi:hypothetical protein